MMWMQNNYDPGLHWLFPEECMPPHGVARPEQVHELALAFARHGWNPDEPALVGYYWENGKVQLLSGSHRWAAAMKAGLLKIPVFIWPVSEVWKYWGTDNWKYIMTAPRAGECI